MKTILTTLALIIIVGVSACQKESDVEPQLIQAKWAHTHGYSGIGLVPVSYCTISETYLPEARYWAEPFPGEELILNLVCEKIEIDRDQVEMYGTVAYVTINGVVIQTLIKQYEQ